MKDKQDHFLAEAWVMFFLLAAAFIIAPLALVFFAHVGPYMLATMFLSGVLPIVVGVLLLKLSYIPESREPRFWKSWRRKGEEVSFHALGVLGISFGLVNLSVTILPFRPSCYLTSALSLLVIVTTVYWIRRKRKRDAAYSWKCPGAGSFLVLETAAVMAVLFVLKWPWAVYRYGTEWASLDPLKAVHDTAWALFLGVALFVLARMLVRESRRLLAFLKRRIKSP